MARLTRRGFVKASSALAAAPALAALAAQAQGPAPDTGNLRVEKDIVFGKGGSMDLTLDVYQPPAGVTLEAHGHHSSLRRRLLRRQQERRLHHQRRQGARRQRLHEHLGELPPPDAGLLAGADSRRQSRDPLDSRERRAPRHRRQQDRRRRLLGRRHALADGRRHERQEGVRGRRRQRRRQLGRQCVHRRLSAGERADGDAASSPQGQATPENIAAASPTTYISATFAPTIFIHGTKDGTVPVQSSVDFFTKLHGLGVPSTLTLIQGADHAFDNNAPDAVEVMAASIDLFLDRLLINPKPYPSFGGGGGPWGPRRAGRRRAGRPGLARRPGDVT